jgi:tetratricopeptide (TPR) repeat protein
MRISITHIVQILSLFSILIFSGPTFAQTANDYYNRGVHLMAAKDYENAIIQFENAVEKVTYFYEAYFEMGRSYQYLQKPENAIESFNNALEHDEGFAQAYYYRSISYFNLGDIPQSLKDLNRTIELNPDNMDAYLKRSEIFIRDSVLYLPLCSGLLMPDHGHCLVEKSQLS